MAREKVSRPKPALQARKGTRKRMRRRRIDGVARTAPNVKANPAPKCWYRVAHERAVQEVASYTQR